MPAASPPQPDPSQVLHWPLHCVLQHTPSAQKPLWHWPPELHATPLARGGSGLQTPLTQTLGETQWLFVVQGLLQAPPEQL